MKKYTKGELAHNEKAIESAKFAFGINETCMTWSDWLDCGYLVRREERIRPLFKTEIRLFRSTSVQEFFGASQVAKHPLRKAIVKLEDLS